MRTERIFILSGLLTFGLGIMSAIQRAGLVGTGGLVVWALGAGLALLTAVGALWVREGVPAGSALLPRGRLPIVPVPLETILPAMLVVGYSIFLQLFVGSGFEAVAPAPAGLSFLAVFWAQAHGADTRDRYFGLAQAALNLCAHLTAFLLFSVIYGLKVRALYSATSTGIVAALLVYEMLRRDSAWHLALGLPVEGRRSTLALLSLAAGLVLAQITWGLNYWAALTTLVGGAFLMVAFYVVYGVVSHYVDHNLNRAILLEFGGVGALGLLVVFASAFL